MRIETIGHACMLIRDDDGSPLLMTDPWLIGSTYWRSWWLQNYPSQELMDELKTVKYAYITHEHMDHFHPPTIRKIGTEPTYLSPALPQEQIAKYLDEKGFKTQVLEPLKWHRLSDRLSALSIPLPNDDSVLLLHTPTAFIVNMNDSKPMKYQIKRIRKYIDAECSGKKVVLLSSYSPASPVNSFRRGAELVSIRSKKEYVDRVSWVSDLLDADYFMPFASQVIFYRSDSAWANEHKVSLEDLRNHWSAKKTQLLMPYSQLDLRTGESSTLPEDKYFRDENYIREKTAAQEAKEKGVQFTDKDIEDLRKKLSFSRILMPLLFRKGVGFILDDQELTYKPWGRKIVKGLANPGFSLVIPTQALKDVLYTGHFADLGITMFTLIMLNGKTNPRKVYLFFLLISLHDYHHLWNFKNFWKWFRTTLRLNKWKIPRMQWKLG